VAELDPWEGKDPPMRLPSKRKLDRDYAACVAATRTRRVSRRVSVRRRMSSGSFALPSEKRFPIHDAYHATLALSHLLRVAGRHGADPKNARRVLAAVKRKWPSVYRCEMDLVKKIRWAHRLR